MSTWKNAVLSASEQFERKREALLREAAASFNRSGYHGTSLTEIAKKLGVTKAALYTYVPSKEELLYYCHASAMDAADEVVDRARTGGGSGLEKLTTTLREYIAIMLGEEGSYGVLLEEHALKPPRMRAIIKRRDTFEEKLRQFVVEGVKDGSIVRCNPKLAVLMIMGAMNWSRKWYDPKGPWTGPQIAAALTQMIERSIASKPATALIEDPAANEPPEKPKKVSSAKQRRRPA